jgi:hypothetical protein
MILQAARAVKTCAHLTELSLGFLDHAQDWDLDLFEILFACDDWEDTGEFTGHKLKRFATFGWFHGAPDLGFIYPEVPIFQNLDCLTLCGINDCALLEELGECQSLRIREFRLRADEWRGASRIIGNGRLKLLHIQLGQRGLNYGELIPLVVRSGSLHSLRLELELRSATIGAEMLSRHRAKTLVCGCRSLQHLSLHADFEAGVWVCHRWPPV